MTDDEFIKICVSLSDASESVVKIFTERKIKISSAESCTGGIISKSITQVPGSSAVIELGVCSYSNRIKREVLGVSEETLEKFSEYSLECAKEMADGAARLSGAEYSVSTTGVAGPGGGSAEHPVGEVFIGIHTPEKTFAERFVFEGTRQEVRLSAAAKALETLLEYVE